MVICITLAVLAFLFFAVRKHTGPAHLAMIAGLSVYEMFGRDFANWLRSLSINLPADTLDMIIYTLLILVFPLLLYFHSSRGGMHGILRLAEAAIFAILMTSLLAEPLAYFFQFDGLSHQIAGFVKQVEGYVVLAGVATAYIDIIFIRHPREYR